MNELISYDEPKEGGRPMIFDYPIAYFGLMMIVCSFLGWFSENVFRAITVGTVDSRFMHLPFLGVYGLCVLALYGLCGTPDSFRILNKRLLTGGDTKAQRYICYCIIIAAAVNIGEIAVGSFCEAVSGKILWNYSNIPLHFTKYTSVPTTAGITAAVFILMKFGFTPLMRLMQARISYRVAVMLCLTLGALIYLDTAWFMLRIIIFEDAGCIWSFKIR